MNVLVHVYFIHNHDNILEYSLVSKIYSMLEGESTVEKRKSRAW